MLLHLLRFLLSRSGLCSDSATFYQPIASVFLASDCMTWSSFVLRALPGPGQYAALFLCESFGACESWFMHLVLRATSLASGRRSPRSLASLACGIKLALSSEVPHSRL